MGTTRRFRARVEPPGHGCNWLHLVMPFVAREVFGIARHVPVRVRLNGGETFATNLMPRGRGLHVLVLTKAMREAAGCAEGDSVRVVLQHDTAPRPVAIPPELAAALAEDARARRRFASYPPSHRRALAAFVPEAKRPETRVKRAAATVARLRQPRSG
ncbi:MAG: DUF1905 domain-containing protein [Planctomycetes bacterium]|nr:DUF1905 domain-containing protein [Planctomycetota bacterium]